MAKQKLEDICEFITDGTHQTPKYCDENGVIFLSSKDVTERKIDWDNVKYIPKTLHEQLYKRLKPQKNDILLAKNGTTGVAAIVDRDEVFDVYVSLAVLRPKPDIYPKYLLYAINSPVAKQQFNAGLKGIGVPNLHLSVIRKTELNIAERDIQENICQLLDKVSYLIDLRQQQLEDLDNLIKARFVELFGNPIKNTKSLKVKRLEELGTWNSGGTPSRTKPEYFTGDINWYSAGELNSLYLHGSIEKITAAAIEESAAKLFRAGSMLVGMYDTAAFKMGILKDDSASNQACACIEPNESVNIVWLYYALSLMKENYLSQRRGVRQKNLNLGMIRGFELPVAEKIDQDGFVKFVEQIDKSKVVVQKALDETRTLFDSLMQEYFG